MWSGDVNGMWSGDVNMLDHVAGAVFGESEAKRIAVHVEAESQSIPGLRSVVSDPLDRLFTFEELWEELMHACRNPPKPPHLKRIEVVEESENKFQVVEYWEAKGKEPEVAGEERKTVRSYFVDATTNIIIVEFISARGVLEGTTYTSVLRDPLRIECWGETPARRQSSPHRCENLVRILERMIIELGGRSKVRAHANVSSPDGSGGKSIITDVMQDYIDYDKLWEAVIDMARRPHLFTMTGGVKQSHVVDTGDNEFTVMQIISEPKNGQDVKTTKKCVARKADRKIRSDWFGPEGGFIVTNYMVFHKAPLRMETWGVLGDGTRDSSPVTARIVQQMVDGIVGLKGPPKVRVIPDTRSPSSSMDLKSAVSDELQDYTTFDELWDVIVEMCKSPLTDAWIKHSELEVVSSTQWTQKLTIQGVKGLVHRKYEVNRVKGELVDCTYGPEGHLLSRSILLIHRSPLVMECWSETLDGRRLSGFQVASLVQFFIDRAIGIREARPVRLHSDAPSLVGADVKSMISDPLDGLIEFDGLWRLVISLAKNQPAVGLVKDFRLVDATDKELTIQEIYSGAELAKVGIVTGVLDVPVRGKIWLDKDRGRIVSEKFGQHGRRLGRTCYLLHRSPLQLEMWGEEQPQRRAGKLIGGMLQQQIHTILAQSSAR